MSCGTVDTWTRGTASCQTLWPGGDCGCRQVGHMREWAVMAMEVGRITCWRTTVACYSHCCSNHHSCRTTGKQTRCTWVDHRRTKCTRRARARRGRGRPAGAYNRTCIWPRAYACCCPCVSCMLSQPRRRAARFVGTQPNTEFALFDRLFCIHSLDWLLHHVAALYQVCCLASFTAKHATCT